MNRDEDLYGLLLDTPKDLHRVKNVCNMSKLIARREQSTRSSQRSTTTSIGSEENGIEDSQVLFMKETTRKTREGRSFSEISHNSGRRLDGPSDGKNDIESDVEATAMEELVANIIDREIHEWQFVCETGRPYWWSPEQKFLRMRKHSRGKTNKYNYRRWMEENDRSPKQAAGFHRRTVSEGYPSDSSNAHSLAQMIAVQLLSSCFTLPPDCVVGLPLPNYPTLDKAPGPTVLDPRMISSLRMHTHFRFSPCFGHEARNTSPTTQWPNSLDGESGTTSIPGSPEGSGFQTPEIGTSEVKRKRKIAARRKLHVTERSSMDSSVEGDSSQHVRSISDDLDPIESSTASQRRRCNREQARRSYTLPMFGDTNRRRKSRNSQKQPPPPNTPVAEGIKSVEAHGGTEFRQQSRTNYRMQPVIRSEHHHVFIQPVRELVVKRWRTLRRRFGGSLHAPPADGRSEDNVSTASESGASEGLGPANSNNGKARRRRARESGDIQSSSVDSEPHCNSPATPYPANSKDGKARRRRARERGDIQSSSVDSEGHCNSPATPCPTPEEKGAHKPDRADSLKASPTFELADPMSAAAALAAAEAARKQPHSGEKLDVSAPSSNSIPASSAKPPTGALAWSPPTSNRNRSYARRASHLRRSRLSEVHTPEDCQTASEPADIDQGAVDRGILSAAGSALASPREDLPSPLATIPGPIYHFEMEDMLRPKSPERHRFRRTSTSGTQVFHPDEDGVEIDGLPVGPGRERWAKKGSSRETTYL
ncbi:hypothetical protein LCER1_G001685 [Lachnellula cervina]|uniref:Uncharacterized protein n=1 Tax=Lachnellula cervina TaxID=1316786 RepID=A0A7D8UWQ2_9HELO|nr:hypothetical protein LCER1_G001685 [Lachnellula cervina]